VDGASLTPRESEVLALVAVGHTSREISERLGLSVRSVESHRAHALRSLGLTSMAEIVSWALHNGHILAEEEEWNSGRFLTTVKQAPLMVLVADAEMRFRDASEAALRELGYSHDELLRLSVPDIVLDRKDAERRYASYRMIGAQHGTITLRRKDRSSFAASYTATVRHLAEEPHYVSVLIPE
jgi:PAS domain S-box-containing protein